ncbi:hypothetical protein AQ505_12220 [Pedobacter sp. PACM 27299]|uniref:hypothetical protein n=1 Tax=Pedobacter sp. PACM 27299 TaxID=1727164 RepID=UPI0007066D31|nr:hypothetical protein [Pedobacter sp. PACM 27299]ALL06188.1 hypothetical protein AQ505_12220 [Pedobacter sp. PACM 27299]
MEGVYRNFYRNFYRRTNGFIPVAPMGQTVYPGDFFQISNGQMIVLGNIFRNQVIDVHEVEIGDQYQLNPTGWSFSDGVTKPYSGRGTGRGPIAGEFEFCKQILAFAGRGSFIFKANEPESVKILNWNEIQQALIIRLTQTYYSFRSVYVVSETVAAADWTLAIAGASQAELEIATDAENFGLLDLFGHHSSRTIQSRDIEFYQREEKRKSSFYKAKKLVLREERMENLITDLMVQWRDYNEWASRFYAYDYHYDLHYNANMVAFSEINTLDMLPPNELNPNTALLYFKWIEASLDDVEKLFTSDGE